MAETNALRLRPRGTCSDEINEQGVFIEIVSRLPVKSICSFKTVCKNWCGFISGKYFAKKQLAVSRQNPTFITCPVMDANMKFYSMRPNRFELCTLNTINPAQRSPENCMHMVASFNGLVCCTNQISDVYDLQIWICNPCTGETLLLPQGTPSFESEPVIGVAYDSDTSDYKVFRIFAVREKTPETIESMDDHSLEDPLVTTYGYASGYECEVYSSTTGSWKNIGPVPCAPRPSWLVRSKPSHVFVDGKIFWLACLDGKGKVLSVDLEGRFSVFGLPRYPDNSSDEEEEVSIIGDTFLINLQGVLSAVIVHSEYLMDVWVRNEEAVNGWEFLTDAYPPFVNGDVVLAMTSLNNKILCVTDTDWWSHDVNTGIWESRRGPPSGFVNPSIFPFTESVLTCNGGVML